MGIFCSHQSLEMLCPINGLSYPRSLQAVDALVTLNCLTCAHNEWPKTQKKEKEEKKKRNKISSKRVLSPVWVCQDVTIYHRAQRQVSRIGQAHNGRKQRQSLLKQIFLEWVGLHQQNENGQGTTGVGCKGLSTPPGFRHLSWEACPPEHDWQHHWQGAMSCLLCLWHKSLSYIVLGYNCIYKMESIFMNFQWASEKEWLLSIMHRDPGKSSVSASWVGIFLYEHGVFVSLISTTMW